MTLNTDGKTKHELSVTNWLLRWAAAKAKLCFGFWGAAINADRSSLAVVPTDDTWPVYSRLCVGNTAYALYYVLRTFVCVTFYRNYKFYELQQMTSLLTPWHVTVRTQEVPGLQNVALSRGTQVNAIVFTCLSKLRPSVCRYSRNSQMLNIITCRCVVPNFTQIGQ